jgi:iron(III) transport system permease protein
MAFVCLSFVKQYPLDMSFSLDNFKKLLDGNIITSLINSLAIALLTAMVGTAFSYFSAYVCARSKKKMSDQVLHFISMLSLAIPGIVLGLSFVLSYKDTPIYATLYILVAANIAHFFSSPYLLAYNSLSKFNPNLEDVAATLGISKMRLLISVYVPSTMLTIVEMYAYYFVNAMITISAVSFLASFSTETLSLMIPSLDDAGKLEGTAIVSLLILAINLIVKGLAFLVKLYITKQEAKMRAKHEILLVGEEDVK